MIYRNKRDQEAWLREKTLESLKANTYFQENDIVQVAENSNFYKVVKTTTPIVLQNGLFAELIPSELAGNIETASKLQTPRNIALTGEVTGNVDFDGSSNVTLETTVVKYTHNHDDKYNTKQEITTLIDTTKNEIKTTTDALDLSIKSNTAEIGKINKKIEETVNSSVSNLNVEINKKANKTISIIAGKGLIGGGDLTANRTLDIVSANEGILVNVDNIELNVVDDLVTGGAKRPLSAEQGKVLKQLLDTIGTGGASQLFRNARTLGNFDLVGQLTASGKSITAGKRLYKPVLYLDGIRIDKNMYDVNLDNGLITLKEPYSKYEVTWVIEDEYPNYIKLSFPTLNMLVNDEATKAEIELGDVIEIQGESEAGDGGHRLVKCEDISKLNGKDIGGGRFLNEIPNTKGTSFWTKNNFDPSTKAEKTHNHTSSEVTGLPTALKNPNALVIQLNGADQGAYDGSAAKTINITPSSIGAQTAGSYAAANHSHGNYLANNTSGTISGNLTVTGQIVSNNNVTAYSDETVKKNLVLLDNSVIKKLKKIKFYNYEMINDPNNIKRVGVKAQELKELFPELVTKDSNGILKVDYIGLNIYFSFAIQQTMLKVLGE